MIWRRKAIRLLRSLQPRLILDVATGTGDFAFESLKILDPDKIIGVDISEGMLAVAREKIEKRKLQDRFEVQLGDRSEEHTSELQSLMRISYAVFCLKKKIQKN